MIRRMDMPCVCDVCDCPSAGFCLESSCTLGHSVPGQAAVAPHKCGSGTCWGEGSEPQPVMA